MSPGASLSPSNPIAGVSSDQISADYTPRSRGIFVEKTVDQLAAVPYHRRTDRFPGLGTAPLLPAAGTLYRVPDHPRHFSSHRLAEPIPTTKPRPDRAQNQHT